MKFNSMHQAWMPIFFLITAANGWAVTELNTYGSAEARAIAQKTAPAKPNTAKPNQTIPFNTAEVRKILDATFTAANKRDVNAVMKYLAPKVTIDLIVQSPTGTRQLQLNRSQYQQYLQQGFEVIQTYDSKLSNPKVQLLADGTAAIATYTMTEIVSMYEPPVVVSSTTDSVVRFEPVNGKILATQIKNTSKVTVKPLGAL